MSKDSPYEPSYSYNEYHYDYSNRLVNGNVNTKWTSEMQTLSEIALQLIQAKRSLERGSLQTKINRSTAQFRYRKLSWYLSPFEIRQLEKCLLEQIVVSFRTSVRRN